jgi:hypothetical protein
MVCSPALYLVSTRHHADKPHAPWVSATVYGRAVAATPPHRTSALLPWDTMPPGQAFCHLTCYPATLHAAPSTQPKWERGQAFICSCPHSTHMVCFFLFFIDSLSYWAYDVVTPSPLPPALHSSLALEAAGEQGGVHSYCNSHASAIDNN